eukprot:4022715-Pleurochrysis_carterae.AAC.1
MQSGNCAYAQTAQGQLVALKKPVYGNWTIKLTLPSRRKLQLRALSSQRPCSPPGLSFLT